MDAKYMGGKGVEKEEKEEKKQREYTRCAKNSPRVALTIVPGAWRDGCSTFWGVTAGLWLGNRLEGCHSGIEGLWEEAARRPQQSCSRGQGRGVAATGFQQGHQTKGQR